MNPALMSVEELAEYLGVPVATIYRWRHHRAGPPAYKVGRFLRFDASEVQAWVKAQRAI